jgi:hypothetical protein
MRALITNWQPTLFGIIAFLGLLFSEIQHSFDDKPETTTDWNKIVIVGGGLLGLGATSRQWNVTSEQAGAKPEKKH